jgi:uncharacterized membrane-anchored protein
MFGRQSKFVNNKGLIFIIDLILATAVVVAIILFIITIKPQPTVKTQYDLVYVEADSVMNNKTTTLDYDTSKDFVCRDYNRVYFNFNELTITSERMCANIIR